MLIAHLSSAQNLLAMMRVGCLEGGMEVEHLKQRIRSRSLSGSSASSSADVASLASSMSSEAPFSGDELNDLDLLAELPKKTPPKFQPSAYVPDRFTLATPPSEEFKIVKSKPRLRKTGPSSVSSMEDLTRADEIGDVAPLVAA